MEKFINIKAVAAEESEDNLIKQGNGVTLAVEVLTNINDERVMLYLLQDVIEQIKRNKK